jgi:hypothetical protein
VILGSGSHKYLSFVLTKLRSHVGPFLYANNCVFKGRQRRNINRLYRSWAAWDVLYNLDSAVVVHAEFGGVTSASHLISYWRVDTAIFTPVCSLPQMLRHVLNAVTMGKMHKINQPNPLTEPIPCLPLWINECLWQEGLFDVTTPTADIACSCVFKQTGWCCRPISAVELLHAFDIPLSMDAALLAHRCVRSLLQQAISPIVITAILYA